MNDCLFCKMITGEIRVDPIYEDESVIVINDINPQASTHLLAIPKKHFSGIHLVPDNESDLFGNLLRAAKKVVSTGTIAQKGYRLVINSGESAGQSVDHIHMHILSGRPFGWPPG